MSTIPLASYPPYVRATSKSPLTRVVSAVTLLDAGGRHQGRRGLAGAIAIVAGKRREACEQRDCDCSSGYFQSPPAMIEQFLKRTWSGPKESEVTIRTAPSRDGTPTSSMPKRRGSGLCIYRWRIRGVIPLVDLWTNIPCLPHSFCRQGR
jgi:hypothetical protein